jgi:hypothetical protein
MMLCWRAPLRPPHQPRRVARVFLCALGVAGCAGPGFDKGSAVPACSGTVTEQATRESVLLPTGEWAERIAIRRTCRNG